MIKSSGQTRLDSSCDLYYRHRGMRAESYPAFQAFGKYDSCRFRARLGVLILGNLLRFGDPSALNRLRPRAQIKLAPKCQRRPPTVALFAWVACKRRAPPMTKAPAWIGTSISSDRSPISQENPRLGQDIQHRLLFGHSFFSRILFTVIVFYSTQNRLSRIFRKI